MTHAEFKAKVLPLSEPLFRIAMYMLEDESDASDAVQDLMLKLWRERDSLDDRDNLKAWCSTMMRNLCVDRIRAAARRRGNGKEIDLKALIFAMIVRLFATGSSIKKYFLSYSLQNNSIA